MKKINSILLLLPFLFSCAQEKNLEPEAVAETIRFEVNIPETKTHLGEKVGSAYPNYWSAGDAISVNGVTSEPLETDSPYVGTNKAEFSVTLSSGSPYYFAYPATYLSNYSNGSARINLPTTQACSSTTYDPSAFIMTGTSNSVKVNFSPRMCSIKLTVPGTYEAKISSVMFESLGTEKVSGPFTTDFESISPASGASPRVLVYAPGEGLAFGNAVHLLIPAQTYASGMRFTISATDGTQMIFSTTSSFAAQAGKVYPLTSQSYTPQPEVIPDGLMIMSSNVRFATARDKANDPDTGDRDWTNRKSAYYAMVNHYRPAVLGLQEAQKEQVKDIKNNCSGYSYYGLGRERGYDITQDESGLWGGNNTYAKEESSTIFYRTDLITLGSHGTIWHSDHPSSIGSLFSEMDEGDGNPQTSTWAIMTYKPTNKQFFMMNTHLSLYDSRPKEISLILNTIASNNTNNLPVIITGDWNLEEGDSWLNPVESAYSNARHTAQMTDYYETYHWWGTRSKIIDHIYYGGIGDCYMFRTDKRKWNDKYISDHYPVFAVFNLGSTTSSLPVADFDLPENPTTKRKLTFTDRSSSPAGIAYWEWDIDGVRSNEQNPQVTFRTSRKNVPVRLRVVDNNGKVAVATKLISVAYSVENYDFGGSSHENYSSEGLY